MALIFAAFLGVFLSLIGVSLIASPFSAVQAFGIDPSHMADVGLTPLMGTRELAVGLAIIVLALMQEARALGAVVLLASIIPLGDFAIAGEAVGYGAAVRHLAVLPFTLILGFVLVRRTS